MTYQPIRLLTNFVTLIPSLSPTKLRVVSIEHLQRVWHASRERLFLLYSFGNCVCSNFSDQFSRTCRVFSRLFILNIPWYFLDFAWSRISNVNMIWLYTSTNRTNYGVSVICETFFFVFYLPVLPVCKPPLIIQILVLCSP